MPAVEKITIALTAAQADAVRRAVAEGRYASTSEAIREAVREWQERRELLGFTVEGVTTRKCSDCPTDANIKRTHATSIEGFSLSGRGPTTGAAGQM